jgi:hypothetical protein
VSRIGFVASNSILPLNPQTLRPYWPFVKQGLEAIITKTQPYWLVEDIYTALASGASHCVIALCDNKPVAFAVYYFAGIPFTDKRELFVWQTWTTLPKDRKGLDVDGAVSFAWNHMRAHALAEHCSRIAAISPRPGFEHFAKRFGMKRTLSTYAVNLA